MYLVYCVAKLVLNYEHMAPLTHKQQRVLNNIRLYIEAKGVPPTLEELKKKAGAFDRLSEKLHKPHVMLASETSLAKDWLSEEEEEAWKDL